MPQIIIFIIDGLTSLINFIGSIKGFKNPENPPMIIEKSIYIPISKNINNSEVRKSERNRENKKKSTDDSEIFLMFILVLALIIFAIWFDRKYHSLLVLITTILSLITTVLYVLQGSKYTLPAKEQIKNWLFFSQPLLFSITTSFFIKTFEYESAIKLFENTEQLKDVYKVVFENLFSSDDLVMPLGIYHMCNSIFYIVFSIALIFFIIRLMTRLLNKQIKILERVSFSFANTVFMVLPLGVIIFLGAMALYSSLK